MPFRRGAGMARLAWARRNGRSASSACLLCLVLAGLSVKSNEVDRLSRTFFNPEALLPNFCSMAPSVWSRERLGGCRPQESSLSCKRHVLSRRCRVSDSEAGGFESEPRPRKVQMDGEDADQSSGLEGESLSLEEEFLAEQQKLEEKILQEEQLVQQRGELEHLVTEDPEAEHGTKYWARSDPEALDEDGLPKVGTVLLANPETFFEQSFPQAMLTTGVIPVNAQGDDAEIPRKQRANLPVVLITKRERNKRLEGLLLGRWSGDLLGDLGWNLFKTRPMYIGRGPYFFPGRGRKEPQQTWRVLHKYKEIPGAVPLTSDELYVSDNVDAPLDFVLNSTVSTLPFKFFALMVEWSPGAAKAEFIRSKDTWLPVQCSSELLLREPDSPYEEPLWSQLAERCGGDLKALGSKHGLLPDEDV